MRLVENLGEDEDLASIDLESKSSLEEELLISSYLFSTI